MSTKIESFGLKLRRLRLRLGVSINDFAVMSGVSKGYLSFIENEIVPPPSPEVVQKIEGALSVPAGTMTHLADILRTPAGVVSLIPASVLQEFLNPVA